MCLGVGGRLELDTAVFSRTLFIYSGIKAVCSAEGACSDGANLNHFSANQPFPLQTVSCLFFLMAMIYLVVNCSVCNF